MSADGGGEKSTLFRETHPLRTLSSSGGTLLLRFLARIENIEYNSACSIHTGSQQIVRTSTCNTIRHEISCDQLLVASAIPIFLFDLKFLLFISLIAAFSSHWHRLNPKQRKGKQNYPRAKPDS